MEYPYKLPQKHFMHVLIPKRILAACFFNVINHKFVYILPKGWWGGVAVCGLHPQGESQVLSVCWGTRQSAMLLGTHLRGQGRKGKANLWYVLSGEMQKSNKLKKEKLVLQTKYMVRLCHKGMHCNLDSMRPKQKVIGVGVFTVMLEGKVSSWLWTLWDNVVIMCVQRDTFTASRTIWMSGNTSRWTLYAEPQCSFSVWCMPCHWLSPSCFLITLTWFHFAL